MPQGETTFELCIDAAGVLECLEEQIRKWGFSPSVAENFAADGSTRLSVFSFERDELEQLCVRVEATFNAATVRCVIKQFPTAAWTSPWREEAQSGFSTERFVVIVGERGPVQEKINIRLKRGNAFGDGRHVTTRLCLRVIEELDIRGGTFLDVGCGNGILSIAGKLLGCERVVGTEIADEILAEARANATLNGVTVEWRCDDLPRGLGGLCDVVVANILWPGFRDLLPHFANCLKSGGLLILAGYNERDRDDVNAAVANACRGLKLNSERVESGWIAGVWS